MTIFPAIDLKDGKCVRLRKGDFSTVHQVASDPAAVAQSYAEAGAEWIHIVDLDGARDGVRRNAQLVRSICAAAGTAKAELGGGLRSLEDMREADDLGVYRFVIGSAAAENPALVKAALEEFGEERVAVGIDAKDGMVRVSGWEKGTGLRDTELARSMGELGVRYIIYTDIERDGELSGVSAERLSAVREAFGGCVTASGGVSDISDVAALAREDYYGCIIGKALYEGRISLSDAIFEGKWGLCFEKSELLPAIVQDAETCEVLMLGYMNAQALKLTLRDGLATFYSRSRQKLWQKGESSGNVLTVKSISPDCDLDTLLIKALPAGPTCHTGSRSCFYRTWEVM